MLSTNAEDDKLTSTESKLVQPRLSVTVTTYVPAARPIAVSFNVGGAVFHEYEYGGDPPDEVVDTTPLELPLQDAVITNGETISVDGSVIVFGKVALQPVVLS